jgi:hypothetical protein
VGPDGVPVEVLRIPEVAEKVAYFINIILDGGSAPPEWTIAHVVPIPKKPGTSKVEEHRGISLLSSATKICNRILKDRLQLVLDPFLRSEQNGFRPGRSAVTQILSLRRILEETKIRQANLVCIFVDFYKAFDSVARGALPLILRAYNVPERLISAIMALYHNNRSAVVTPDGLSDTYTSSSGVLQGDTLAPFLFTLVLDWVLRTGLPCNDDGFQLCRRTSSRHPEKRLACLAYADDLALMASTGESAQRLLNGLAEAAAKVGLVINISKTEVLTVPADLPVDVFLPAPDGKAARLARCEQFRYLGGIVPSALNDLRRRRSLAWGAFRSVRAVLQCATLSDSLRARLFKAVVETVLLYNAESWTMTDALERQLDAAQSCLLRASFRIHHASNPISTKALYERVGLRPASTLLKERRLKMIGHVLRARSYRPEPLQDVLFLSLKDPFRRGQGKTTRFVTKLFKDANAPDEANAVSFVTELAIKRMF